MGKEKSEINFVEFITESYAAMIWLNHLNKELFKENDKIKVFNFRENALEIDVIEIVKITDNIIIKTTLYQPIINREIKIFEIDETIKLYIFEKIQLELGIENIEEYFEVNEKDTDDGKGKKKRNKELKERIQLLKEELYGENPKEKYKFDLWFLDEIDQTIFINKNEIDDKLNIKMNERIKTAIKENQQEVNHIIVIREEINYNIIEQYVNNVFEELHINVNTIHFMSPCDVGLGACQRAIEIHQFGKNQHVFDDKTRYDIEYCIEPDDD